MKTPFRSLLFILLGAGFALPVQCGLIGETINIDRLIPSEGFDYDVFEGQSGAYTVGVSSPLSLSTGNNEYASTTNTDLIVDFGPFGGYGGGIPDHEIVFSGLYAGTGLSINGVTIGTNNVPGLIASDITFTANSVTVAIGNINYTGGQVLDVSLETSAVPEPSTFLSALLGVGSAVFAAIRKSCYPLSRSERRSFPS
jgi:hypothetical protein